MELIGEFLGSSENPCGLVWTRPLPDNSGALSLWLLRIPFSNCLLVLHTTKPFSTAGTSSPRRLPYWAESSQGPSSWANSHSFYLTYQIVDVYIACSHCCSILFANILERKFIYLTWIRCPPLSQLFLWMKVGLCNSALFRPTAPYGRRQCPEKETVGEDSCII